MNILETIVNQKRVEVERLPKGEIGAAELRSALAKWGARRDFVGRLQVSSGRPQANSPPPEEPAPSLALIAEVKKASPSAGVICTDFDPVRIAREYEAAGASCLSVLTDEKFFQGALGYLKAIRDAVELPLLRKDFIIDERQILEAMEWGADAVLLIVAILSDAQLKAYLALAEAGGLAALVEVHDEIELERALQAGARLIGVNNRNLRTFKVDLATTERLAELAGRAPGVEERLLVAESGIHTRSDVVRLAEAGAGAMLVGESLMREGDIKGKVSELLGRP